MTTRAATTKAPGLGLVLEGGGGRPLYLQVDRAIRGAIEAGRLKPGDRVPSVADLAEAWGIHKLTVLKAFRGLEEAGLLESHVGRGTFVRAPGSRPARDEGPARGDARGEPRPEVARAIRRLRDGYARGLRELMNVARKPGTLDLTGGVPSPDTVPDGLLDRLARRVIAKGGRRLYEYGGPAGLPELRAAIARTLARTGTVVGPDEVIVTNGSQQAVALVAAWARDEGRAAFVETPSFTGIAGAFSLFGHAVASVPWAGDALDLDRLRAASAAGRRPVAYVCPDFHNPTGQTLSEGSRRALSAWAREGDGVVVDDQIFREMRFEGDAPPSLYATLPPGRRFLVGSVSKSFMTGLRVGFLVADAPLVADLLPSKRHMDLGGPALVQAIAAAFLEDGYEQHLAKMRAWYRARRDAALEALAESMPEGVTWTTPQGGFQLWVTLPRGCSSIQLFLQGLDRGVAIVPGPAHDPDGRYLESFRLGYGQGTPAQVREGVRRLGEIAKGLAARGASDASSGGLGFVV